MLNPYNKYKRILISIFLFFFQFIFIWSTESKSKTLSDVLKRTIVNRNNGDYEESYKLFLEIEKKSIGILTSIEKNVLFQELGSVAWILGNPSLSIEYFNKMKENAKTNTDFKNISLSDDLIKIIKFYNAGKEFRIKKGNYKESILSFKEAIELSQLLGRPEFEMKCLRQMSANYYEQGRLLEFRRCNDAALIIARKLNCWKDEGFCLNNIGAYYIKIENYSKSIEYFEKSLKIARSNNIQIAISECLSNIAIVYKEMGYYGKSLDMMFETMKIDKILNNIEYIAIDYSNIGSIYRRKWLETNEKEDLDQALKYLSQSYELTAESSNNPVKIRIANNLGTISNDRGEYSQAIKYFQRGLVFAENKEDKEAICILKNNLGISFSRMGQDEEALKCFREAIEKASESGISRVLGEAFLETAEIQKKKGAYDDALKSYQYAIGIMEKTRAAIEDEDLKTSFWRSGRKPDMFHGEIDLLFRMEDRLPGFEAERLAFECMERAKARGFLDRLEIGRVSAVRRAEARMDGKTREIQTNLSRLFRAWYCDESLTEEKRTALERDIQKNEDAYEGLRREARSHDPLFSGLRFPKIVSIDDLPGKILRRDAAIFTYAIGRESAYGLVITRNNRRLFRLPQPETLRDLVTRHLKTMSDRESAPAGTSAELYRALISPGLEGFCGRIIIIPDDFLYYLPFETLRRSQTSPWLGTEMDLSYAPSVSALVEIEKREKGRMTNEMDLLAVASAGQADIGAVLPAPFGEWEANEIMRLYDSEKSLLLKGKSASEQALKKVPLGEFSVIHFAAHGLIDEQRPIRSAIVLSSDGDSTEDGLLQAREIFETRLNASLVVLSACRSAAGRLVRGEGLEGLNRSFMFAGASAVLTSLWPIDYEATAHLMGRFHVHLREGDSINGALRRAKMEMLASAEYSHPAYWAGFVITGLGDQRLFAREPGWIVPAAAAFAVVLAAGLAIGGRRRRSAASGKPPAAL